MGCEQCQSKKECPYWVKTTSSGLTQTSLYKSYVKIVGMVETKK